MMYNACDKLETRKKMVRMMMVTLLEEEEPEVVQLEPELRPFQYDTEPNNPEGLQQMSRHAKYKREMVRHCLP